MLGSFANGIPDRYSDIDLYVVLEPGTREQVMAEHRRSLIHHVGDVGTMFPATHLGHPNQLVVFYEAAIPIHVDYQYQESGELLPTANGRDAVLMLDRTGDLEAWKEACANVADEDDSATADRLQYIEDRFWGWCWYAFSRIERGELWEARDAIEYIRTNVLVLLATVVAGLREYEGARRLERKFPGEILDRLRETLPTFHSPAAYHRALASTVEAYLHLFASLPEKLRDRVIRADRDYFLSFLRGDQPSGGQPRNRHLVP